MSRFMRTGRACLGLVPIILATALVVQEVSAEVTGDWPTTGLTRIVVSDVLFPENKPERTVEVAESQYQFGSGGPFTAGDIVGVWTQQGASYSVRPSRPDLVAAYVRALRNNDPKLVINSVRLLQGRLIGTELDNGIWGSESYIYRLDFGSGETRQVLRVTVTVHVASAPAPAALSAQPALPREPTGSRLDAAAAAVLKYRQNHPLPSTP